jgi:hypothetical protein
MGKSYSHAQLIGEEPRLALCCFDPNFRYLPLYCELFYSKKPGLQLLSFASFLDGQVAERGIHSPIFPLLQSQRGTNSALLPISLNRTPFKILLPEFELKSD